MAVILRRYWSDIVVLTVCLAFCLLLLGQGQRSGHSARSWDSGPQVLVMAKN
jgi:hypothetical protein